MPHDPHAVAGGMAPRLIMYVSASAMWSRMSVRVLAASPARIARRGHT
jgi:hypothetical protein